MVNNGKSAEMPKTPTAAELREALAGEVNAIGVNGRLNGAERVASS